jgi:exoribonuclease II
MMMMMLMMMVEKIRRNKMREADIYENVYVRYYQDQEDR